jgi:hypothetical protein
MIAAVISSIIDNFLCTLSPPCGFLKYDRCIITGIRRGINQLRWNLKNRISRA